MKQTESHFPPSDNDHSETADEIAATNRERRLELQGQLEAAAAETVASLRESKNSIYLAGEPRPVEGLEGTPVLWGLHSSDLMANHTALTEDGQLVRSRIIREASLFRREEWSGYHILNLAGLESDDASWLIDRLEELRESE